MRLTFRFGVSCHWRRVSHKKKYIKKNLFEIFEYFFIKKKFFFRRPRFYFFSFQMKKMKNFLDPPDDASLHFTLVFVNIFTFFCLVFFFVSTGVSIFEFGFFSFFFTFLYFVSFAPEFRRHVLFCLFVCLFFFVGTDC